MKITGEETKSIKPDNGFLLTQNFDIDLKDRFFTTEICLAINDSIDNYKEISIEEANKLIEEQNKLIINI